MRFVWLDVPGGGEIPVNPDQVAYLRAGQGDHQSRTEVVFGAVNGGLHSVIVTGEGRAVADALQGVFEAPPITQAEIDRKVESCPRDLHAEIRARRMTERGAAARSSVERLAPSPAVPASPKAKRRTPKASRPQRT